MDDVPAGAREDDVARAHVRALATRVLPLSDQLAGQLVQQIVEGEPAYLELDVVAAEDLHRSCRQNLERIVQSLGEQVPPGTDPYDAPAETGRRRAAQGMPLEAVLHSYRLGGRLIWDTVVALGAGDPADPANLGLLRAAGMVWEEIDRYSSALAEAYRREQARLRTQHRYQQQADLSDLLDGRDDGAFLVAAPARLGVPEGEPAVVLAVLLDAEQPVLALADELAARGVHAAWALRAGVETGLVRLGARGRGGLVELLRPAARSRVGVSPVLWSLRAAGAGERCARLAATTLPAGPGVALIEDRLPQALLADAPDLAGLVLEQTVRPVLAAGREGPVLLDTVKALRACGGSYSRAAGQLFCHRNTVIARTEKVRRLCGHDPAGDGALLWDLAVLAAGAVSLPPAGGPAPGSA